MVYSSAGKNSGLSCKDELYNDIVDDFKEKKLDFPRSSAKTEGSYFVQVGVIS